jgi:hypothetical protein
MRTFILTTFLCGCFITESSAQSVKRDSVLIRKIDTMFKYDQFWRIEYIKVNKKEKSAYDAETIQKRWTTTDSLNEIEAKAIIKKHGYPGYDLVGDISDNFWAIVQHCDNDMPFQKHVLALMKAQIAKGNASKEKYAYLVDRVLVNKNQKQIYGTQLQRDNKTGKFSPFQLKYPTSVNKLRKEMGLKPLDAYIKELNNMY